MIRFESDYLEGALPQIMYRLMSTNFEQTAGYGCDPYCESARELIKKECAAPDADIHFLVGGTQTNMTVIAAALRPHQGVLAAETSHIEAHETGAIEATGHKIITLDSTDGKINAKQVEDYVLRHRADESFEHIVQPAMVYISQPTETGTVYTLPELEELSAVCRRLGILLYVDGARLACALACGARIIGVNNRNLKNFTVDIGNSERLRRMIPSDILFVAESGIKTRRDVEALEKMHVDAVLIGETLMRAPDKKHMLDELRGKESAK